MKRHAQILAVLVAGVLGAAVVRGQVDGPPDGVRQKWIAINLADDPQPQRMVIINGQLVPDPSPPLPEHVDLPIVNDGFAGDEDVKSSITPLVEGLRSVDFEKRDEANGALLRLPPRRLQDVVEALARARDAESIERLTQVAAHLFLKPRTLLKTKGSVFGVWHKEPSVSMLGLKFHLEPVKLSPKDAEMTMTVQVTELQPGFPAMQMLRNGDRIVAIGGEGFPLGLDPEDSTYFRGRVAQLWPGAVVDMLVLRDGLVQKLGVQVAGLPLNGPVTPDAMVAQRQAALAEFMKSLKTGDGGQAMVVPLESEIPKPTVIFTSGWGGGDLVPMTTGSVYDRQ